MEKLFQELDYILNMEIKCSCPKKVKFIKKQKDIILKQINKYGKVNKLLS
tara:strand:- start:1042 stop:1191 length:150 start_codon:yes stop_codon:yes gene_type:complete